MATTLRLPHDLKEAVRATAAREGRSEHAVILAAVERYTSERARRRAEAVDRILAEDAGLLDDLA